MGARWCKSCCQDHQNPSVQRATRLLAGETGDGWIPNCEVPDVAFPERPCRTASIPLHLGSSALKQDGRRLHICVALTSGDMIGLSQWSPIKRIPNTFFAPGRIAKLNPSRILLSKETELLKWDRLFFAEC